MESDKGDSVHLSRINVKALRGCHRLPSVGNRSAVCLTNARAPRGCTTKVARTLLSLQRGASAVTANLADPLCLILVGTMYFVGVVMGEKTLLLNTWSPFDVKSRRACPQELTSSVRYRRIPPKITRLVEVSKGEVPLPQK